MRLAAALGHAGRGCSSTNGGSRTVCSSTISLTVMRATNAERKTRRRRSPVSQAGQRCQRCSCSSTRHRKGMLGGWERGGNRCCWPERRLQDSYCSSDAEDSASRLLLISR